MNKYIEYFMNYVTLNYDMEDTLIAERYYHSLRVAKIMAILAKKMNMCDSDIELAFKLGLCHDLGRFYEITLYDGHNSVGFDHGNYSNKILFDDGFVRYMDISDHTLFRNVVYYHNKKDVPNDLSFRESIFTNMLRDADKIDIMLLSGRVENNIFDEFPTEEVLKCYQNNLPLNIRDFKNDSDKTLLHLSFIKDLYFDASYDIAIDCGYLDALLDTVDLSYDMQLVFNRLVGRIYERRGSKNVR